MATPERGLKDHEIAQLVNAIRDNVVPICASQQLRARIESALTSKLGEMGLRLDGPQQAAVRLVRRLAPCGCMPQVPGRMTHTIVTT